ncbi:hypothetical protein PPL_11873 [Heterostelium album PN500]|uniref:Uncharacterized protein n=1 Tax=Heterostelium pallidum (strain ATCC 26659 / Pp 5 / PN500) TaxID=670386 RepID=D3BUQ2_HETP5|nr:hypothetical protein PPL_11873 [Heterostelium album PN500]EFA74840.1 hypothetical protein PPL_11873 [Heterostelium album PN500]|eukprot:XP_020426974.1 hypothetical protein PPL_11873 [Heterostelium album PN500]
MINNISNSNFNINITSSTVVLLSNATHINDRGKNSDKSLESHLTDDKEVKSFDLLYLIILIKVGAEEDEYEENADESNENVEQQQ